MVHNYHYTLVLIIWVTLFFFWNHRIWLITISPYFLAMRLEEIAKIFRETQLVGSLPNGITRNWMIWWQIWRMLRKIVWVVPGTLSLTYTQLSIMYWCYTVSKIIQNNLYSLQFRELKMHHIATVSDYTCKLDNYKPSQLQVLQHVTVLVIEHHHFTSWCCSASLCHGRLFPIAGSAHRRLGSIRRSGDLNQMVDDHPVKASIWKAHHWFSGQFSKGNHGPWGFPHLFNYVTLFTQFTPG